MFRNTMASEVVLIIGKVEEYPSKIVVTETRHTNLVKFLNITVKKGLMNLVRCCVCFSFRNMMNRGTSRTKCVLFF